MFIVVLVVMLPTYLATKDAMLGLSSRPGVVLHHRRDRAARRVRRAVDPQGDSAGGHAGYVGGHLNRVHLDAPGVSNVGGPLDRVRVLRDRADRLDCEYPAAGRRSRRPRCGHRGRGHRLGRHGIRLERLHEGRGVTQAFKSFGMHLPWFSGDVFTGLRVSAAARYCHSAGHLQLHGGHEQRGKRLGGRRQLQSAQDPHCRWPRRDRRLVTRKPSFRRRFTSGIPGGRRWAVASATRSPPGFLASPWFASWV